MSLEHTRSGSVIVIGSGPSLFKNDLASLSGVPTFCLNHTLPFMLPYKPTHWTFWDNRDEFRYALKAAQYHGVQTFITHPVANHWGLPKAGEENLYRVNGFHLPGHCDGCTADLALGIAVHLGYARAFLLGFDGGGGHIVGNWGGSHDAYRWIDYSIREHAKHIEIVSAGAYHGLEFLPHVSLEKALELCRQF